VVQFTRGEFQETERLRHCRSRRERVELLADFIDGHRKRLRLMVVLRLHEHLRGRIDPSDVLQEVYLEAARRLEKYLKEPALPLYLWLRRVTADKLRDLQRYHLGAQARDARREVRGVAGGQEPGASSVALARQLAATGPSPSEAAIRAEQMAAVQAALEGMNPLDREVLVLKYFEQLSDDQVAQVLGLRKETARKRYFRALARLSQIVGGKPLGGEK
jgi:RNA polymerase sigma-70 factor (ECF subfamily)